MGYQGTPIKQLVRELLILPGCLAAIVFAPVWIPIAVAVQAHRERKFRREMERVGRFVEWNDLLPKLEAGEGTLIVEQAQKDGVRIWWTSREVGASSTVAPPAEEELDYLRLSEPHQFVAWCKATFLDRDSGSALLTNPPYRYPPGFVEASFFREKFPRLQIVMTVKLPT